MKVLTSSIISQISGKLGEYAGKHHRSGQVISKKSTPYQISQTQRSAAQQTAQQKYAEILTSWQALTQEEKDAYDLQGARVKISGWNYYMRYIYGLGEALYGSAEYDTSNYE